MNEEQVTELLYQALETEIGGTQVYETAIRCAVNPELKEEWEKYGEETREHERILRRVFEQLKMDPEAETPGRQVIRHKGQALVQSMEMALKAGKPVAAQLVAAECVVEAETKDHRNWELIGKLTKEMDKERAEPLKEAFEQVEDQEDEHLYHTMGWARELWLDSLGLDAVLPPPEETKEVKTALEFARVKEARDKEAAGKKPAAKKSSEKKETAKAPSKTRAADKSDQKPATSRSRAKKS